MYTICFNSLSGPTQINSNKSGKDAGEPITISSNKSGEDAGEPIIISSDKDEDDNAEYKDNAGWEQSQQL